MAFLLTILFIPKANTIVTMAGSPSGIAATARLIDVMNISSRSLPCNRPIRNTKPHITRQPMPKYFPN